MRGVSSPQVIPMDNWGETPWLGREGQGETPQFDPQRGFATHLSISGHSLCHEGGRELKWAKCRTTQATELREMTSR